MTRPGRTLTAAEAHLLRTMHDDGQPKLRVANTYRGGVERIDVTRADGSELSESEARHVRAVLAAIAAEYDDDDQGEPQ